MKSKYACPAPQATCDLDHYNQCGEPLEKYGKECAAAGTPAKAKECLDFFLGGDMTVEYCCPCILFYAEKYALPNLKIDCTPAPAPSPSPPPPSPPPPPPLQCPGVTIADFCKVCGSGDVKGTCVNGDPDYCCGNTDPSAGPTNTCQSCSDGFNPCDAAKVCGKNPPSPPSPPSPSVLWTRAKAARSCDEACAIGGETCVETAWPESEIEFNDIAEEHDLPCEVIDSQEASAWAPLMVVNSAPPGLCQWKYSGSGASPRCTNREVPKNANVERFCPCTRRAVAMSLD